MIHARAPRPRPTQQEGRTGRSAVDSTVNRAHQHATNMLPRARAARLGSAHRGLSRITRFLRRSRPSPSDHARRPLPGWAELQDPPARRRPRPAAGDRLDRAGQAGDSPMLNHSPGAPAGASASARGRATDHDRTPCWATRRTPHARTGELLRAQDIKAVIAEPADQAGQPPPTWLPRRPTTRVRLRDLQRPQRRRAVLQRPQAMARPGHPLRQARHRLPRRHVLRAILMWLRQ